MINLIILKILMILQTLIIVYVVQPVLNVWSCDSRCVKGYSTIVDYKKLCVIVLFSASKFLVTHCVGRWWVRVIVTLYDAMCWVWNYSQSHKFINFCNIASPRITLDPAAQIFILSIYVNGSTTHTTIFHLLVFYQAMQFLHIIITLA